MARKDVENYRNQMTSDYLEMKDTLKELEELAMEKVISPEKLDEVQRQVDKLKENLDRVNYIMYLLNKPVKKSKQPWYRKRNDKLIKEMERVHSTLEDVHKENKDCINHVKNI